MEDKFYAVIDTNVIVSAVISKGLESNPADGVACTINGKRKRDWLALADM